MITETFNPIVKEESYTTTFFPKIPMAGPKKAILLLSSKDNKAPLVIINGSKVTTSEIRKGKYDTLVEIDLHPHIIRFKDEVQSEENILKFTVEISATATVTEPDIVYDEQIIDVAKQVESEFMIQIQEIASNYSIKDSVRLRQEIKDNLGNICYLGNGISINNINVIIQVDQKYKKQLENMIDLQYKDEYESEKAKVAEKMKHIYRDNVVAVFSEFAAGKIGVEDAISRSDEILSRNFDERLRQVKEITNYIRELGTEDMIDQKLKMNKANTLLNGLMATVSETSSIDMNETNDLIEDKSNKSEDNIFASFDDE